MLKTCWTWLGSNTSNIFSKLFLHLTLSIKSSAPVHTKPFSNTNGRSKGGRSPNGSTDGNILGWQLRSYLGQVWLKCLSEVLKQLVDYNGHHLLCLNECPLAVGASEPSPSVTYPYKIKPVLQLDSVLHYPRQHNKLFFSQWTGFTLWLLAVPAHNQGGKPGSPFGDLVPPLTQNCWLDLPVVQILCLCWPLPSITFNSWSWAIHLTIFLSCTPPHQLAKCPFLGTASSTFLATKELAPSWVPSTCLEFPSLVI